VEEERIYARPGRTPHPTACLRHKGDLGKGMSGKTSRLAHDWQTRHQPSQKWHGPVAWAGVIDCHFHRCNGEVAPMSLDRDRAAPLKGNLSASKTVPVGGSPCLTYSALDFPCPSTGRKRGSFSPRGKSLPSFWIPPCPSRGASDIGGGAPGSDEGRFILNRFARESTGRLGGHAERIGGGMGGGGGMPREM
jgi:hypothetical protein